MKITVNIKVIKWHNENLLTLTVSNKSLNNEYVVVNVSKKTGVNKNNFNLAHGGGMTPI